MVLIHTVKISSQGQIVLPKKIRDSINVNTLSVELNELHQIILTPVRDVAGALAGYAINNENKGKQLKDINQSVDIGTKKARDSISREERIERICNFKTFGDKSKSIKSH